MGVYALSIHADYRCRHSGVCCSSDWDVPVEVPIYRSLEAAIAAGRVVAPGRPHDGGALLIVEPDLPEDAAAMIARTNSGDCVFYHRSSGLCVVHRDLGEPALPATCRHFPRVAVRDWRGTSISLTHFCPTAADMLFRDDVELAIVENPPAFPDRDYEGLEVEPEAWPPLLHPQMLMDVEGYAAWERHMVARCADESLSPEAVVATLWRDALALREWKPGHGSLADAVRALPRTRGPASAGPDPTLDASLALHAEVIAAIPDDLRPEPDSDRLREIYVEAVRPHWESFAVPLRRYLAAKAFANWTAYQGRGILTIVRGLEAALALVRVEAARECRNSGRTLDAVALRQAIRASDFLLNHLAIGESLAEQWAKVETGSNW